MRNARRRIKISEINILLSSHSNGATHQGGEISRVDGKKIWK